MSKMKVTPVFVKEFNLVLTKLKAGSEYKKVLSKYIN
jgi:hypothetical protein